MHTLISLNPYHVPFPQRKNNSTSSGPPLVDVEAIQASEDVFLLTTDRRAGPHNSNARPCLMHSTCGQSGGSIQLFLSCEEEHELMRRRERKGPGEKIPNLGGRATTCGSNGQREIHCPEMSRSFSTARKGRDSVS